MSTVQPNTTPALMSKRQFAAHIGCKPSYITELHKAGRLVMSADGKQVDVAASLLSINATRDPSKAGVAGRHAAQRGTPVRTSPVAAPVEPPDEGDDLGAHSYDYQASRAKKEHWQAAAAQDEYLKAAGKLSEATRVKASFAHAGATLRSRLEGWVSSLPPQLAQRDEAAIRMTLDDAVRALLSDLADIFDRFDPPQDAAA